MIRVFATRQLPVMDIIEVQGRIVVTPEALAEAQAAKAERHAAREERRRTKAACADASAAVSATSNAFAGSNAEGSEAVASTLPSLTSAGVLLPPSSSSSSSDDSDSETEVSDGTAPMEADGRSTAASPLPAPPGGSSSPPPMSAVVVEVPLGNVEQDLLSEKRCTLRIDTLRINGSRSTYKHPLLVLRECSAARMQQLRAQLRQQQGTKRAGHSPGGSSSAAQGVSARTQLFSEWLQEHPQALSLHTLYLDDIVKEEKGEEEEEERGSDSSSVARRAPQKPGKRPREEGEIVGATAEGSSSSPFAEPSVYKNYELVGVVRNSVLFNSKPARVFQ